MKLQALCRRTTWEIVRDPLNLAFGLGFPLVLLLLLSAIQANVPVDLFAIDRLTPGISVFGLAFIALFSATLVARDRESALLQRLYTAPLTAGDFIFGYVLPLVPMAAVQAAVCYLAAVPLGLTVSVRMLWAVLLDLPAALLFIGLGLLCGSVMNVKQVGSICGALLTEQNEVLLVRQFRYPYKEVLLELPAGKLEKGEDPVEAVKREQMEETGTTGENYIALGNLYPSPGYCGEIIRIWACRVAQKGEMHLDDDEFLEVERIPLDKAVEMVLNNEIPDSKTQVGILKTAALVKADKL